MKIVMPMKALIRIFPTQTFVTDNLKMVKKLDKFQDVSASFVPTGQISVHNMQFKNNIIIIII